MPFMAAGEVHRPDMRLAQGAAGASGRAAPLGRPDDAAEHVAAVVDHVVVQGRDDLGPLDRNGLACAGTE